MIHVKVDQIFLSNMGFVVLLKGLHDERSLPIFIGAAEAQAIAIHLNGISVPRPLTHDLLKNVLDFLECRLMRVEVCDLADGTFFARLNLDRDGVAMELDSRPSDAIALALRFSAPIFVAEKVMDEAGRVFEQTETGATVVEPGKERHKPEQKLSPLQTLEKNLEHAIREERYEDAARLRDEINRLKSTHSKN